MEEKMSKTKGFSVDFTLPDGKVITRHVHKLDEVKSMVNEYKIPSVTIHSTADKWTGNAKTIEDLNKWPLVPDKIDPKDDDCPICSPKNKK
jgi:hypothetical protein